MHKGSLNWSKIDLLPFLEPAAEYDRKKLRSDLFAGLTVAIFAVPQTMAYAMLAGVPPAYGLYTAMVMSIFAALLGSSSFLNSGPSNSSALMTSVVLASPLAGHPDGIKLVATLALLVGIIRTGMGLLRCGNLIRHIHPAVFIGFTAAAGVLIPLGQLHYLIGVERPEGSSVLMRTLHLIPELPQFNGAALIIGLSVFLLMASLNKLARYFPVALLAIAMATITAQWPGMPELTRVHNIAVVSSSLPHFQNMLWDPVLWLKLLPGAFAVAVVGLAEAVSISRSLALRHDQKLNYNQEFFGQGVSQMIAAFFMGMPGSGSFGRTKLIEQAAGQTRFANAFFGIFTALGLVMLAPLLNLIPICALSGLLLFLGAKLFDFPAIGWICRESKSGATVWLTTFLLSIVGNVIVGFIAGVVLGLILHPRNSSKSTERSIQ